MSEPSLRALEPADVADCARLHRHAFPSFFLSSLGEPFLREFYRAFLTEGSVTRVARAADGSLSGVVVGHVNPTGFFRRLLVRRWYAFAWASLGLVLRRPKVVPRMLRAFTYRGQVPGEGLQGALLSSICVAPSAQGTGLGRRLIDEWTWSLAETGVGSAFLTTDADGNDTVNSFYVRAGWMLASSYETPEGRNMNCYIWRRAPKRASDD